MSRVLLKGARLVDPASGHDGTTDVLVEDSLVSEVGPDIAAGKAEVVDCEGLVVSPGLVDIHAHLREPGREESETVETGSRAAALGGYTAVCAMPNTDPVADHLAVVLEVGALGEKAGLVDVFPAGAITKGLDGEELSEMGELAEAGVRLFTDDGRCVQSARVMRLALEYTRPFDAVVCSHAEDESLTEGWQMHEGYYSALLGLRGAPREAEEIVVARDLLLARLTGGRLHLTHLSSAGSVEQVRRAKVGGVRVTADVTPHHLAMIEEDLMGYEPDRKMNPPLRSAEDRDALREGLADGTIDAVGTDHAPHSVETKEVEFDRAPPGTIGLETSLGAVLTEVVEPGIVTLKRAVEALSATPARVLGLDEHGGPVAPGRPANLVVFDPGLEWTVGPPYASRSRNSALAGRTLRGRAVHTMLRGRFTVKDGEATG